MGDIRKVFPWLHFLNADGEGLSGSGKKTLCLRRDLAYRYSDRCISVVAFPFRPEI
jgi:hypothetical protein